MKKQKGKGKIETMRETLALAKSERPVPANLGISARLGIHEVAIENHLANIDGSFFEIGKELAQIRDEQDFAEDTFEQYGKNRWNKPRDWCYKMIQGYEVKAGLPANVLNLIQNQGQALALGRAPKEKHEEILKEVSKSGEKVTAKAISEKVEEIYTVPADFTVMGKEEALNEESDDVDEVTGLIGECKEPDCIDNRRLVKVLERKIRVANLEIGRLREDKEAEMKRSPFYKNAEKIFNYWKEKTGHNQSKFGLDVYKQVLPYLKSDGIELCFRAVEGIAFQHYKGTRLNGTEKKYDSFELCFRNRTKFEEYCCRSPKFKKQKVA